MSVTTARGEDVSLSIGARTAYASGSFATGVFSTVPTVLLLFYCTETLHLPVGWAGMIVFIPKLWALIWDPLVGAWSDRTRSRFGRRRPFMVVGALGLVLAFAAVFRAPILPPSVAAAWVAIAYFALTTVYSAFAVPYIALPAEIGRTSKDRSQLVSWRMVCVMLGILTGAGLAPMLVQVFGGGQLGYGRMGLVVAVACGAAMAPTLLMLRVREPYIPPPIQAPAMRSQLIRAWRSARFRLLVLSYLLQLTAIGLISSAAPYVVTRLLGRSSGDVGTALSLMLLAALVSIPIWSKLSNRSNTGRALVAAVLLYAVTALTLGATTFASLGWGAALSIFGLLGVPFGGLQVLPFILATEIVAREAQGSSEGAMTGVWTASEKLGLALGPAATAAGLSFGAGPQGFGFHVFLLLAPAGLALSSLVPLSASLLFPAKEVSG